MELSSPLRNYQVCSIPYIDLKTEPERFEENEKNKIKYKWQEGDGWFDKSSLSVRDYALNFVGTNPEQAEYSYFKAELLCNKEINVLCEAAIYHHDELIIDIISVFGKELLDIGDYSGLTPLTWTIRYSTQPDKIFRTVKTLLCLGANPNMVSRIDQATSLWYALEETSQYAVMNLLRLHGAISSPKLDKGSRRQFTEAKQLLFEAMNVHLLFKGVFDSNSFLHALFPEIAREIVLKRIDLFKYRSFMEPCQPIRNYPMCSIPYIDLKAEAERIEENEKNKIEYNWQEGDGWFGKSSLSVRNHALNFIENSSEQAEYSGFKSELLSNKEINVLCEAAIYHHDALIVDIISIFGKELLNTADVHKLPPLIWVIRYPKKSFKMFKTVKTLLCLGANPNMTSGSSQGTSLWYTLQGTSQFAVMNLLRLHGAIASPELDQGGQFWFTKAKQLLFEKLNVHLLFTGVSDSNSSLNTLLPEIARKITFKRIDLFKY